MVPSSSSAPALAGSLDPSALSWPPSAPGEESLLPLVAQSEHTGQVLMVGWVNRAALEITLGTKEVTFWSRSRRRLWKKGEQSGNVLSLRALHIDCDSDTLLALVEPAGPTCHRHTTTCFDALHDEAQGASAGFDEVVPSGARLAKLFETIEERAHGADEGSYARKLVSAGLDRCLRKFGEEATEFVVAAKSAQASATCRDARADLAGEAADVLFHLFATLVAAGVPLSEVIAVLAAREGKRRPDASLASKI